METEELATRMPVEVNSQHSALITYTNHSVFYFAESLGIRTVTKSHLHSNSYIRASLSHNPANPTIPQL